MNESLISECEGKTRAKMSFKRLIEAPITEAESVRNYVLEIEQKFNGLQSHNDVIFVCGNEAAGSSLKNARPF